MTNINYIICVYDKIGEHGDAGQFEDFQTALKEAERLKEHEQDRIKNNDTWYIGVEGVMGNPRFAVVHCSRDYLDVRISEKDFQTVDDYETFVEACERHIKTEETVESSFMDKNAHTNT